MSAAVLQAGGFPKPALSQRLEARTLRLVPHADVSNFDPIWNGAFIARNAAMLVFDTLYGVDAELQPRRQMVLAEEVSADGLSWTFRLRPNLKFHDGEPVLAKDVVASINRWAAREPMGGMIKAIENELTAVDDTTVQWRLKKPFPKMLLALGKIGTPCCFIMPARIAATDPFKQITDYVGSGPTRFVRSEWVPGAKAVFEKFTGYVPRDEPASWMAGGKTILADRIEWIIIPDPATAAAALQNGEIDWVEQPLPDLVPVLRKSRDVVLEIQDKLGTIGILAFNHLQPPFDDVHARRAVLQALSQEDYMRAFVGDVAGMWKPMPGYVTPGTPLYTEAGGEILKGARPVDAAKKLLSESSYAGKPVVTMAAQDIAAHKAFGDVTADLLGKIGMNVDYAATDWGTVIARRAVKKPVDQGGWNIYHTTIGGADGVDATNKFLRANGEKATFGWPSNGQVEAEIASWYDAKSLDEEKAIMARLNKAALDHVVFAPLGLFFRHQAWRRNVTGIKQGPMPFFWGVGKSV